VKMLMLIGLVFGEIFLAEAQRAQRILFKFISLSNYFLLLTIFLLLKSFQINSQIVQILSEAPKAGAQVWNNSYQL
jgi:hypothetical protein